MEITIELYGYLKTLTGAAELQCEVSSSETTVGEVVDTVAQQIGIPRDRLGSIACAVGEELVLRSHRLRDGEVLVLLPPVSGG